MTKLAIRNNILLMISFTITFLNSACNFAKHAKKVEMYDLTSKIEMVKVSDKSYYVLNDTVGIIYYDDFTIIKIPITEQTSIVNSEDNGRIVETILNSQIKNEYFIYQNKKGYGLLFQSLNDSLPEKFPIDSILNTWTFKNWKFFNEDLDSLVFTKSEFNGDTKQTWVPTMKPDLSYADSTYLFFSKSLNNLPFSFSPELDRVHNSKLYKVKMIYNSITDDANTTIPRREYLFEIKKSNTNDIHPIINFIHENKELLKKIDLLKY